MAKLLALCSKRFLVELSTLAATSGGLYIAKALMPLPRMHPSITPRTTIVKREPGIALVLSQLASLDMPTEDMAIVIDLVEQILIEARDGTYSSQGRISRLNGDVIRRVQHMCDRVCTLHSASLTRNVVIAREDVIPVLVSMLNNVLHNHLLSRS